MSWLKDWAVKVGAEDIVKIYEGSPDKVPEGFDIEKTAKDFLEQRESIFKTSDSYKTALKEANIVAIKKANKLINEKLGLGLTGEEIAKADPDELLGKAIEKFEADKSLAANGRTSEIQKKLEDAIKEANKIKLEKEELDNSWKTKYDESENRFKVQQQQAARVQKYNEILSTKNLGTDEIDKKKNAILMRSELEARGWTKWDDKGLLVDENGSYITGPDNINVLPLSKAMDIIGTELKLFPQSNASGGNRTAAPPPAATGNPEVDQIISKSMQRLEALK